MKEERIVMGMPARVELVGADSPKPLREIFDLWDRIDERFSTYKSESELMRINRGELAESDHSAEMREAIALAQKTKSQTRGYFDARRPDGSLDLSGVVKGSAIAQAAQHAARSGFDSYYLEIGGDIQTRGTDASGKEWTIGVRNPFDRRQIVKVLYPRGAGVATSGIAARGDHIYNPHEPGAKIAGVASLTVVGSDVCEADRFATAAFAMGKAGIRFIEELPGFEGYLIDDNGVATMTSGLERYLS